MDDASLEELRDLRRRTVEQRKLSEKARQESERIIDRSRKLLAETHDKLLIEISPDVSRNIPTRIDTKR
jgi:hypothetical protein